MTEEMVTTKERNWLWVYVLVISCLIIEIVLMYWFSSYFS